MTHVQAPRDEAHAHRLGALLREVSEKIERTLPAPAPGLLLERARAVGDAGHAFPGRWGWSSFRLTPLGVAVAAVLAGAVVFGGARLWRVVTPEPLGYSVRGGTPAEGAYITTRGTEPTRVEFSDGSTAVLSEDARLRVQDTFANGAVLVLERGASRLRVRHTSDTRWEVLAGPYSVSVVGTEFVARWDPSAEQLQVLVESGAVRIAGGALASSVLIPSGQRLTASSRSGTWEVERLDRDETSVQPLEPQTTEASQASESDAPSSGDPISLEAPVRKRSGGRSPVALRSSQTEEKRSLNWAAALAQGQFSRIVEEARALGVQGCLSTCALPDVRRLADAARYTGKLELAQSAYLALRERDPSQRATYAYLLATAAESAGQSGPALGWYERCLNETGGGKLDEEARVGRLRLLDAMGRRQQSRAAARDYLDKYPQGVGAKLARGILTEP